MPLKCAKQPGSISVYGLIRVRFTHNSLSAGTLKMPLNVSSQHSQEPSRLVKGLVTHASVSAEQPGAISNGSVTRPAGMHPAPSGS